MTRPRGMPCGPRHAARVVVTRVVAARVVAARVVVTRVVAARVLVARLVVATAAAGLLAGCVRGVDVAVPAQASDPACAAASASWPGTVAGQPPAELRTDAPSVRAWGDPAVIARCGVDPPGPTALDCVAVDGIDWVIEPLTDGTRFTTYGRSPAIEVLVPKRYAPEPLLLPAFGPAASRLPETGHHCT
ncbi:MAG: DUF3515 family protein [Dermatophilaceae bacterium]